MIEWVLIIFIQTSFYVEGENGVLSNVAGFESELECNQAGAKLPALTKGTVKVAKYVCVKKTKQ